MRATKCAVPTCVASTDGEKWCAAHAQAVERFGHPTELRRVPEHLPDHLATIWEEMAGQVTQRVGLAGMEALCTQIYRLRRAQRTVTDEGMVVADAKGNPVPHPALKIEKEAQIEVRRWVKDFGVR